MRSASELLLLHVVVLLLLMLLLIRMVEHKAIAIRYGVLLLLSPRRRAGRVVLRDGRVEFGGARRGAAPLAYRLEQLMAGAHG